MEEQVEEVVGETETKFFDAPITKAADGSFVTVASTNTVDRHGEIVHQDGWDLKAYKKNPVILWAHDHTEPAIGVAKRVWVDGAGKKAKLMMEVALHDVTEKARAIKQLVEMGVVNSMSVSYKVLDSPDGINHVKNELLETSVVNVPANADAMMLAYKGLKTAGFDDKVIKAVGVEVEAMDTLETLRKDIEELKTQVTQVKAQQSVNPSRERLSLLKVISRSSDKILEADKKHIEADQTQLVKAIKKATEILTVAEKENL